MTRLTTSRFFSGSRSMAGLRSDALSSFTSPFLCSITTPAILEQSAPWSCLSGAPFSGEIPRVKPREASFLRLGLGDLAMRVSLAALLAVVFACCSALRTPALTSGAVSRRAAITFAPAALLLSRQPAHAADKVLASHLHTPLYPHPNTRPHPHPTTPLTLTLTRPSPSP